VGLRGNPGGAGAGGRALTLGLVAYLALVLFDLESADEPPLFHPQDEGTVRHLATYRCTLYPRPWWH